MADDVERKIGKVVMRISSEDDPKRLAEALKTLTALEGVSPIDRAGLTLFLELMLADEMELAVAVATLMSIRASQDEALKQRVLAGLLPVIDAFKSVTDTEWPEVIRDDGKGN